MPQGLAGSLRRCGCVGATEATETVKAIAQQAEPLAKQGRPEKTLQSNVLPSDSQGNAADYLTRRIARDRPDILERMKQGEYRSVRAAATARDAATRERIRIAAEKTTGEVLPRGGDENGEQKRMAKLAIRTQPERAESNGISVYTQRKLDRLAREHPALHVRVRAGELSVNRAAMRQDGMTYQQIADVSGVDDNTVQRAIAEIPEGNSQPIVNKRGQRRPALFRAK